MNDTVLLLTVGGSCEPVVNAINYTNASFVYFICSSGPKGSEVVVDGAGKPCKERDKEEPSIVQQTRLKPDQYEKILLDDPDDLESCFEQISSLGQQIAQRFQNPEVIANYSGGTKTMSVALAIVASQQQWKLQFNRGIRVDLVKVRAGTDKPVHVGLSQASLEHYKQAARLCLDRYDYAGAEQILTQALNKLNLSGSVQQFLIRLQSYCNAFEHWERFDYATAADLLESLGGKLAGQYLPALRTLRKAALAESGYWRVYDLLMNAERRAAQKRYDDAVARLYRAVEMLAQTRLSQAHQIDSSDVDINKLPEHLREQYAHRASETSGKVQLALTDSYMLLSELNDPVGVLYKQRRSQVLDAIGKRNRSYLAHGTEPIGEKDYTTVRDVLTEFIEQAIQAVSDLPRLQQLPRREILDVS